MAYFIIKNITNKLEKRHISFNQSVDIEYITQFERKIHKLATGREMVINSDNLPLAVHILKAKNLISVKKLSESEYKKYQQPKAAPKESKPEPTETQTQDEPKIDKKFSKKRFQKSETEEEV